MPARLRDHDHDTPLQLRLVGRICGSILLARPISDATLAANQQFIDAEHHPLLGGNPWLHKDFHAGIGDAERNHCWIQQLSMATAL